VDSAALSMDCWHFRSAGPEQGTYREGMIPLPTLTQNDSFNEIKPATRAACRIAQRMKRIPNGPSQSIKTRPASTTQSDGEPAAPSSSPYEAAASGPVL